jgi:predicted transcriptional regulator of viral defense system
MITELERLEAKDRIAYSQILEKNRGLFNYSLESRELESLGVNPKNFVARMKKRGLLESIQRGRYVTTLSPIKGYLPPRYHPELIPSILLSSLSTPYYISWHSALSYYNLIESASNTTFAAVIKEKCSFKSPLGNVRFVCISSKKFFGYKDIKIDGYKILMATPAKAILDSFILPENSGSFSVLISSFKEGYRNGLFDGEELVKIALRLEMPSLNRRLGFLMDRYNIAGSDLLLPYLGRSYAVSLNPGSYKKNEFNFKTNRKWRVVEDELLLDTAENLK